MDFLIVLSGLLTSTGLILLFILFLLSEKLRREIALMYLSSPKPKQFYKNNHNKTWKINNSIMAIVVVVLTGSNFAVRYHEVSHKTIPPVVQVEKAPVVKAVPPTIMMNEQVFYYCLNAAKNKEGLKAEVINACKEAAIIELVPVEDKVKYTLSKRDIVF